MTEKPSKWSKVGDIFGNVMAAIICTAIAGSVLILVYKFLGWLITL